MEQRRIVSCVAEQRRIRNHAISRDSRPLFRFSAVTSRPHHRVRLRRKKKKHFTGDRGAIVEDAAHSRHKKCSEVLNVGDTAMLTQWAAAKKGRRPPQMAHCGFIQAEGTEGVEGGLLAVCEYTAIRSGFIINYKWLALTPSLPPC